MKKFKMFFLLSMLPFFLSACTKSGALTGSSAGSGGSFGGSINGSVNGGLSPIAGAAVSLYLVGNPTALASATTTSTGAFTLRYTNPGTGLLYLLAVGGTAGSGGTNSNIQIGGILGLASNAPSLIVLNEATTGALFNIAYNYGSLKDNNGTVTLSSASAAALSNMVTQYNAMIANGSISSSLSSSNQNLLGAVGNSLAACIQNPSNCGALFKDAANASQAAAVSIQDALYNMANGTANVTNLYALAAPLAGSTGFLMPGSQNTLLNLQPVASANIIGLGAPAGFMAVDASGNLWVEAFTCCSSNGQISKISPSGALLGTFSAGGIGNEGVAIDASGNVWLVNLSSNTLIEMNPSGAIIQTIAINPGAPFTAGIPLGLSIDPAGNLWTALNSESGGSGAVEKISASGVLLAEGVRFLGTPNWGPWNIVNDASGNAWVTMNAGGPAVPSVIEVDPSDSTILQTIQLKGTPTLNHFFHGIAIDGSGNIIATGAGDITLQKYSPQGVLLASNSQALNKTGIALDALGNLFAYTSGNNIVKFNSTETTTLTTYSSNSQGINEQSIAIDASGNLWAGGPGNSVAMFSGITLGPQFFPYSGPVYP